MAKKRSLTSTVSSSVKDFNLQKFKEKKLLTGNIKFKSQEWIPFSKALQEILSVPGVPHGHVTLLRGHSDTGKTTALLELAVNAQKMGKMPVFIITEMKWSWEHAQLMGLEIEEIVNEETGEIIDYDGHFLYVDRSRINTIEDVASFIMDLVDEQKKGNLPFDLVFLWDSVGSVPCELSVRSNKNNNEWNAGAMSTQFGNNVNQKITLSRKETSPFTNSLICINKIWTMKAETPMSQPKIKNKGGETMWYDSTFVLTFGNVTNSGTSKIKARKDGKEVEFAKRTKVQVDKNHINGISTKGNIIMTSHGFILEGDIDSYKKEHSQEWSEILGGYDFDIIEEQEDPIEDMTEIYSESTIDQL
jgi:RecA/RadA recombinase